jgi:hypothetical protein
VFDVMPTVMLPVRIDKLTGSGRDLMRRMIEMQIAALQAQQETLRGETDAPADDLVPGDK